MLQITSHLDAAIVLTVLAAGAGTSSAGNGDQARNCGSSTSAVLPMSEVAIAPRYRSSTRMPIKPDLRSAIGSVSEWKRVWNRWAPGVPVPEFNFRDSVLIVATMTYSSMPLTVELVEARCSRGDVVVSLRARRQAQQGDLMIQGIAAMGLAREDVNPSRVSFVTLPDLWTKP